MYLGIDLGGTKIAAGLVDDNGRLLRRQQVPTARRKGPEGVIGRIVRLGREVIGGDEVEAVGIGVPGLLDPDRRTVLNAPNLGWKNVEIADTLAVEFCLPVAVENDANAAAMGEYWVGAAKGLDTFALFTIGTGIGSALFIGGKLWRGVHGLAAEAGHISLSASGGEECRCGHRGCFETVASATAIVREARMVLGRGGVGGRRLSARTVIDLARKGDSHALGILDRVATNLGMLSAAVINLLDPEAILIGGGVSRAGSILLDRVRRETRRRVLNPELRQVRVELARLGNEAGIVGAAAAARSRRKR